MFNLIQSRPAKAVAILGISVLYMSSVAGCPMDSAILGIPEMGRMTPPPVQAAPATLLSVTKGAAPFTASFTPTAAGKTITVSVAANVSATRPNFVVTNMGAPVLQLNGALVNSNIASGSFVSTGTTELVIAGTNAAGAPASSEYVITVTQAP